MLQRRKLETRSLYRSVRYRVNRDQFARTADPSACNFRIKKNSLIQTMAQTIDTTPGAREQSPQMKQIQQMMKTSYLQSFHSMMQRTDRIKIRFRPQKQSIFCDDRIILPNFTENEKQVQQSQHSLLTPFMKPYGHVKLMYLNCQNQLKSQKVQCQQIKYGLRSLKQSKLRELSEIQSIGKDHFANIRSMMRKNQIAQQEKKLKTKRQLQQLEQDHEKNRKLFEQIDQKSSGLQITIFNSTPFNLRQTNDKRGEVYF